MPRSSNPAEWTYRDAAAAVLEVAHAALKKDDFEANEKFIEQKDHWQDGARWVGPNGGTNAAVRARVLESVHRQFAPVDVVGEVVDRVANALLKTEASVSFAPVEPAGKKGQPSKAQAAEADAMRRAIAGWWDRERLWELARDAVRRTCWAKRGTLRLWIPEGMLEEREVAEDGAANSGADGEAPATAARRARVLPEGLTMAEALALVKLAAPTPHRAAVVTIEETQERVGVVLDTRPDTRARARAGATLNVAEIWRLTEDGAAATVRLVYERGAEEEAHEVPLPRLPLSEMTGQILITDPVRRQQDQVNFANSLLTRVMETAGFPERYVINAAPEGGWSTTAPTDGSPVLEKRTIDGVTYYLHAVPRTLGAAVTSEPRGFPYDTKQGEKGFTTPNVIFRDPTDPEYLTKAKREARATILEQCKQGHILANSEAAPSGYSREQARADYEDDLGQRKAPLEGMLREILEGAIALGQTMATADAEIAADFLDRFRVVVTVTPDSGPLSPDERRAILEEYRDGVRSRIETMQLLGVEDPDAELAKIDGEEKAQLARLKGFAEALAALANVPGGGVESAARTMKAIGLDPAIVDALVPRDTDGGDGGDGGEGEEDEELGDDGDEEDEDLDEDEEDEE